MVTFRTTKGRVTIEVHRDWAPLGADRFYQLARNGFYDGAAFYRVVPNFVVQWGISPRPEVNDAWRKAAIKDDPVHETNARGTISFAAGGKDTRTCQVYINLKDNQRLDPLGFAVFGKVVQGMDVVDKINSQYGEMAPRGKGPDPARIRKDGYAYLKAEFPALDLIQSTKVKNGPAPR